MEPAQFTQYEKARILGARALQIAMNAPLLIKISEEDLEKVKYDALKIAEIEFESGVLPISVKQPMPKKKKGALKRVVVKEEAPKETFDEVEEAKEMQENEELMELAQAEDEIEEGEETPEELQ